MRKKSRAGEWYSHGLNRGDEGVYYYSNEMRVYVHEVKISTNKAPFPFTVETGKSRMEIRLLACSLFLQM